MAEPVSKDPARIAGMFDAIARRYDLLNHLLSAGLDRSWRRRAIQSLRIAGHETLLDVCTGTADVALAASGGGTSGPRVRRTIGVDFAVEMLRIGQRKIRDANGAPSIWLVRGDASLIPLSDRSVDLATIAFGIRNVQEPSRALREIARVLKPGGRLAVLEFGDPSVPGLRELYRWYFRFVLPRVGALVSRHRSAYSYLPASVGSFPLPAAFLAQIRAAGFSEAHADPLTLGIVYLYSARK
ncbi:MAG: bifunctional demethylmenaquinone methyltransferase/2-methoxy-6-polyprenyl-1,4-benzoquinol methylase UbiE [Acidobacteria bacterium]|nr:bifunctional demethylmenaquinone methyltransferase/2-methoxy-6-polyprenyl-1,4-benzoquinol methylase UbiE [Acidobacteriota bacterium]